MLRYQAKKKFGAAAAPAGGGFEENTKCLVRRAMKNQSNLLILYNILHTVSTQHQYSNIMYAIGYTMATCFDRKRSSTGQ